MMTTIEPPLSGLEGVVVCAGLPGGQPTDSGITLCDTTNAIGFFSMEVGWKKEGSLTVFVTFDKSGYESLEGLIEVYDTSGSDIFTPAFMEICLEDASQ